MKKMTNPLANERGSLSFCDMKITRGSMAYAAKKDAIRIVVIVGANSTQKKNTAAKRIGIHPFLSKMNLFILTLDIIFPPFL